MKFNIKNILIEVDENEIADTSFRKTLIERLSLGQWEQEESDYIHLIPADSCVLELGGCIGFISCLTNSILTNKEKHVVLEANSSLIPILEKNKILNSSEFHIENKILSNSNGKINFYIDNRSILGSSTTGLSKNRIKDTLEIEKISLYLLQKKYGLKFDALICDIEGGEYELFENTLSCDDLKKINFLSVEFHWTVPNAKNRSAKIIDKLRDIGFDLVLNKAKTGQLQLFGRRA